MSSSCDDPGARGVRPVSSEALALGLERTDGPFVRLPNELVEWILSPLGLQALIRLRLVCKRWQMVIENINSKQKSLILQDHFQTSTFRAGMARRFFGELGDLSTFAHLKLKGTSRDPEAVGHFRALLLRLFPAIQQLVIAFWTVNDPAFVFDLWPPGQLTTLSFNLNDCTKLTDRRIERLYPRMITSLTRLKRLDLDLSYFNLPAFEPNLARLEHLSCSRRTITPLFSQWNRFMSRFVDNSTCTRYWNQSTKVDCAEVQAWNRVSGHWLSRLTHLALFVDSTAAQLITYLSGEASSLRVLHLKHNVTNRDYIFTLDSTTIRQLARLVHLTELELDWVAVNVSSMELAALNRHLASLERTRVCRLTIYRIVNGGEPTTNTSDRFMRALSIIVPNVEQLTIAYYCAGQLGNIELYLEDRFNNLREHDFVHRMMN